MLTVRRRLLPATFSLLALAPASLFVSLTPAAFAQSSVAGAISGVIYDQQKAVVPGAAITAVNNDTQASTTATSDARGEYRLENLTPGVYTVTVTKDGFKTFKQESFTINVGVISQLAPSLVVGSSGETVDVAGDSPLMHVDSSEISSVIDQNMIDNLPINGRRASNFALLTPGVVSNGDGFGLLSFRGISFLLNNSTVDGMDDNQAYFSEQRGRTRAAYSISQSAVQEFQVNTSNFSAEYGRSAGGVINTVTKSGGNSLHGQLFFFDRDNDFGASNPYTVLTSLNPATGNYITQNYKPKDWRKQWGFGIGGALIHDKLFWFYSYDQSRRNFPGTATASTATAGLFAPADPVLTNDTCSGGKGTNVTSSLTGDYGVCALAYALNLGQTAAAYQAAASYYGAGQAILASYLGAVPRNSDQVLNFPKLDWQINDRNHLALQYNRLRVSSPAGVQTQQINTYGRASFGNDFVKEDFGIMRLASTLSSTMTNELRFQYGRDFEYGTSQTPTGNEQPLANNQFNRPPDVSIGYDYDAAGFDIGKPLSLERKALPDERRIQGSDGFTWAHGKNTTKAGLDFNRVNDYISNLYNENGSYSEDSGPDFMADYFHAVNGLSYFGPNYYQFSQGFGTPSGEIATTDYAGYLTNDWRILPRLTLTAGVRYEYEYIPVNPYANLTGTSGNVTINGKTSLYPLVGALPQTASRPDDRNNVQPRLGFAWDVFGNASTTVRGGYGIYNGRIINANILQVYLNSGGPLGQFYMSTSGQTTCTPALTFPNIFQSGIQGALNFGAMCGATTTAAYLDPHLQNPQVHEIDLAIEQQLGHGTVMQISYMGSLGRELASAVDKNLTLGNVNILSDTYTTAIPATVPSTGYQLPLPRGGKAGPLAAGSTTALKLYTLCTAAQLAAGTTCGSGSRTTQGVYQLLDFKSDVNSAYNAMSIQLTHRFSQGYSFMAHYTWAHALDYNPYLSTNDGTNQQLDPNDLSQEYGNSTLNVQSRFVFSGNYRTTLHAAHRWETLAATGWQVSAIFQTQTGLPYSAMTAKTAPGGAFSGIIGAGGINRLPKYDVNHNLLSSRDSYNLPNIAVLDMRLSRSFFLDNRFGHFRLEFLGEAFNVLNHQNITKVNTTAYTICTGTVTTYEDPRVTVGTSACPSTASATAPVLLFNPLFGTNTASNSNTIYTPRQLEGAIRLHF
ncbi:TonB-dependent Receptor Plug Domain [Granulicella rosea]|uniref:TonB-dependent Receptor Plug Domain n=1 Tax=Granulicella rosea TaxID=474952 RepID=A0A239H174_9BACT|nr:carboxypeptidase regulatory-like domain-containing protein [Granulicella rosea]SNS75169.1 TonB-dependent Receptor Plug Domain [Granulicella rosea]